MSKSQKNKDNLNKQNKISNERLLEIMEQKENEEMNRYLELEYT